MLPSTLWGLVEAPIVNVILGVVLGGFGLSMLAEYRRLFLSDPKTLMSAEVWTQIFTGYGGPGYLAAFLLAGALLCFSLAVILLLLNVISYLQAQGVSP